MRMKAVAIGLGAIVLLATGGVFGLGPSGFKSSR